MHIRHGFPASIFPLALACCALTIGLNWQSLNAQDEKQAEPKAETKTDDAKDDAPKADDTKADDAKAGDAKADDKKVDDAPNPETKSGDDSKTADNTAADDDASFASIQQSWNALDAKLKELAAKFEAAIEEPVRDQIKKDYAELVKEAQMLAPKLQTAAIAEFKKNPNQNEPVTRLLIGAIVNDIVFQRVDDALEVAQLLIDADVAREHFLALRDSGRLNLLDFQVVEEIITRKDEHDKNDLPRVRLETEKGEVVIELFEDQAPGTVGNFISLVEKGFYNGLTFHRVIDQFVAQGGDPKGDGTGGPGYKIKSEFVKPDARRHFRGVLSMANSGKDTGGSQFFIVYRHQTTQLLDTRHTVFGRVVSGMDVVDKFTRRNPTEAESASITPEKIVKIEVLRKRDHAYAPDKVPGSEETTEDNDKKADENTGDKATE
jgi:cyclophilin family peptidyl-prolyl cis-trans isomerase